MKTKSTLSFQRGATLICLTALLMTFAGVASAAPNVISVSPTSAPNTGPLELTLTGTGFVSGASALLQKTGQSDLVGTSVTVGLLGTQLKATFNLTAAPPGDWDVRVINPDASSDVCAACFTVTAQAPTVGSTSPSSRGQGATSQNIAITGTNFAQGAQASFSGTGITVNSTIFVNTTQVTANITISPTATTGPRNVTVTNTDAQSGSCTGCFTVNAGPVVTNVTPPAATNSGSVQLTFTGTGFASGSTVALQLEGQPDIAGTAVIFTSSVSLKATFNLTAAAPSAWDVLITNPDQGNGGCTACFTIAGGDPTVTDVIPDAFGQGAAGQELTLTGTNFAMGADVAFSGTGITVDEVVLVDPTELSVTVSVAPAAATGARNVTVTNTDDQSGTCIGCFTVNAGPAITDVTPDSLGQGATNQNLTVTGTGFVDGATASFSGTGITVNDTTFVSPTNLTVNVTISGTAATGARNLTITNPDQGTTTCTGCFTVNAAPTITDVEPDSLGQGATNQDLTVTGTGFVDGATASFSGTGITVNDTTFVSPTELTVNVTISAGAPTGARNLTITNPDKGTTTCTGCFTVNAIPSVTSVSPDALGQGATAVDVTITGTGFQDGATASFSGTGITVNDTTFVSATELTANITISGTATQGTRNVTVTNPDAGTPATCTACFTVNLKPTATSVTPNTLGQGAQDQDLVITGTAFQDGAVVSFSGAGITVNETTFDSSTTLTVNVSIASGATTGARDVVVTNPDEGTPAICSGCFTVATGPTVTDVSPAAAANTGPVNVTITGTGFAPGATVTLEQDGQPDITGTSVTVDSPTTIHATFNITGAAPGDWDVRVTNTDEGSGVCVACFTVAGSQPTITSVDPSSRGQGATDQDITITGTNFAMGADVTFSGTGITVNDVQFVDTTELIVNIDVSPTATTGPRDVTVTNTDDLSATCTGCFTVNAKPTATAVQPSSRGQGAANQNLTVSGTNFQSGAAVTFSGTGITVNGTTFNSATSLTVNVSIAGNAPATSRDVTVTNPDGGTPAVCTACFTVNAAPTATDVQPDTVAQGAVNQTLTVVGTNFQSGATVTFSGTGITVHQTTFVDASHLTVKVSVSKAAATTARDVTVTNPDGGTPATCTGCLTVVEGVLEFTPAVVKGNTWYLNNNTDGVADVIFAYGSAADTKLVGDWDGNGTFTAGVVKGNTWYLNNNTDGVADVIFAYGSAADTKLVGDWDGFEPA
jgi:hypothetical protein